MKEISGSKKAIILFIVLLFPGLLYLYMSTGKHHFKTLPVIGEREGLTASGDTIFHTVPDFHFMNQEGKMITQDDYKDKIYVADFFFTSCPTICPKMSASLQRVQDKFKAQRDIKILSFSVDPEHDSVPVLNAYARKFTVDKSKWNLVTGEKKDIYELAVKGYLVPVQEDVLAPGGFLHSEMMALIDKEKRIRGFYDGTDAAAVDTLMDEIVVLMQEYKNNILFR